MSATPTPDAATPTPTPTTTRTRPLRTLPVRRWLALCLLFVWVVPVILTIVIGVNLSDVEDTFDQDQVAARLLRNAAAAGPDHWQDPAWHADLDARFAELGMDAILFVDGNEIFRTSPDPLADTGAPNSRGPSFGDGRTTWQVTFDDRAPRLSAQVFDVNDDGPPPGAWIFPVVGIISLALTLTVLAWLLGRMLVRPLAQTSAIAHEIAAGNLDRGLPPSRVREIDTVRQAFDAMRSGLRTSIEEQAAIEQERRLLISAVAHDLRTPLFALRGYLEGISTGVARTDEQRARYLQRAQEQANTLERRVSDLFDYARLEFLALDQTHERTPFDLADLIQRVVDGQQPRAAARGITLRSDLPANGTPVVADPHLLTRVIENLLDNALRYTPPGGDVVVSCGGSHEVWFRVSDSGLGIPPSDLPHLFAPLFRGDASRSRNRGNQEQADGQASSTGTGTGAGLGLTTAQRIMQAHGGTLRATNRSTDNPQTGAIFTGTLPASGTPDTLASATP